MNDRRGVWRQEAREGYEAWALWIGTDAILPHVPLLRQSNSSFDEASSCSRDHDRSGTKDASGFTMLPRGSSLVEEKRRINDGLASSHSIRVEFNTRYNTQLN